MNLRNSIAAGLCIGLAGCIYLTVGGVIGSLFFALGLSMILLSKFDLFTGKCCYLFTKQISCKYLLMTLLGNFIGVLIISLIFKFTNLDLIMNAEKIVHSRLNRSLFAIFNSAVLCGLFMYIAVVPANTANNFMSTCCTILAVSAFILTGSCHCIADMFYYCCAPMHLIRSAVTLAVTICGNLIGCSAIGFLTNKNKTP